MRIGQGVDVHKFGKKGPVTLCGVKIPSEKGLLGHSDADVAIHALMDALLGALAEGDIGKWFPDTDPAFKNADSVKLLEKILSDEIFSRWEIVNLDITIIAETPRIAQYVQKMREKTAVAAGCEISRVSVKATTTEKLGFCGRGEGIVATAVVLLAVRNFPAN